MPGLKVGLITGSTQRLEYKNLLIFSNAFLEYGCQPVLVLANTLSLLDDNVSAACFDVERPLAVNDSIDKSSFTRQDLSELDYIWAIDFGLRGNFLDITEFLWMLEKNSSVKFINSIDSILYYSNKYVMSFLPDFIKKPETYVSNDADFLYGIVAGSERSKWIVKPPAENKGRNVFLLHKGDTNVRPLLQMLTGYAAQKYCILQEYITEIESIGDKRVLIANGKVICNYTRLVQEEDHRTNLCRGSKPVVNDLSSEEIAYCQKIGAYFKNNGVSYVGLDMVYPYILEANVINPGGLNIIHQISGMDYSLKLIESLMA